MRNDADFYAVRVLPGTKTTFDINLKKGFQRLQSYRALSQKWFEELHIEPFMRNAIAVMGAKNRFVIIDVDAGGDAHKYDGRAFWAKFAEENSIPTTYTVMTKNGGYHYYFKLPDFLNEEDFRPPSELAKGVDVIFNGYVLAPPTSGYSAYGSILQVEEMPTTLLLALENKKSGDVISFDTAPSEKLLSQLHDPFSDAQIVELRARLKFFQEHGKLSYQEWRDGIFSLKAGLPNNTEVLHEFVLAWTYNQTYQSGDEIKGIEMADNADTFGGIGPGTIFSILKNVAIRENAITAATPHTKFEIVQRSGVKFSTDREGNVKVEPSESNASSILKALYPEDRLHFDTRKNCIFLDGQPIQDSALLHLVTPVIQSEQGLGLAKIKINTIGKGLEILLTERSIDPHLKMIQNAVWDGVPRIENFFQKYCHVTDSEYVKLVSKNMWVALAARGVKPGSKFDSIIVIEGFEGLRKSSLVRSIGGAYTYACGKPDLMVNENELAKVHQATIAELPELIGLAGQDHNILKGFTAQTTDSIRPPYARRAFDHPRGFLFIGTTNEKRYIPAGAGERRFWPISIPRKVIDTDAIEYDREQLYAEGMHFYREGYEFWRMPRKILIPEVQKRKKIDPLEGVIKDFVDSYPVGSEIKTLDAYVLLEGRALIPRGFTPYVQKRIESMLYSVGWEEFAGVWRREADEELVSSAIDFGLNSLI